ncbi:NADH-quinone oxidoreductase subunit M [Methylomonas sp. LL1]|uniref:complex I subunit 4 family protein n=1 Tax=Methylomonas sp. LL1 TaxID=2785785 RepID=UPI0018C44DF9|nr:NADH-quinone oxidoreductase subunit M [Methylomonas sp. LL1]QPK62223.1 NADH-quinone oxidoreductase subunit M [Methylomonas sp. LL1]
MIDSFPLLSLCLTWPILGAVLLAFIRNPQWAKRFTLLVAGLELVIALVVVHGFDPNIGGFQLREEYAWIPGLNIHYQLGIDGISVLFLPMTALVTLMALLASWNTVQHLSRFHLALMLLLETVTIGVFTALDLGLFFLFWELTLPPIFFLIGLWGIGAERRYAAMKYTLYMLFGGIPLLFGFILLALNHAHLTGGDIPGDLVFSLPVLLNTPLATADQGLIFLLLMLGFAVKAPLLPFHTWLPTVAMEAPTQISALLMALKLGVYGILRFAIPLAPSAAIEHRWLLAIIGAITLVYAGLIALQQTNLRRLLAYSGISHVGLVLMGIASFTLQGLQGAVMQLLNFSIVAGSLMLVAGMIQQRLGSTDLVHLGGLAKPMPRLTTLFFLFGLSSIGVPLTNGFPAELLLLIGVLEAYPSLAIAGLFAAVLGAAYLLGFVRRGFFGPITHADVAGLRDIRPRELLLLAVPALLVLMLGLYPQWLLSSQEVTLIGWLQRLHQPTGVLVTRI